MVVVLMTAKLEYTKYVPSNDVAVMHSYSPLSSKPTIFSYVIPSRPVESQNKFLKNIKFNAAHSFGSTVAVDPGFPRGRLPTEREGTSTFYLAKFRQNCMKIKKIGPGVARSKYYYVDPSLNRSSQNGIARISVLKYLHVLSVCDH